MIEYLSIDPGGDNGICGYDENYALVFMKTIPADEMIKFLNEFKELEEYTNVKKCIIESYRVYPNKAKQHIYSDLETSRVIGRVESWAETNGIELIAQPSTIKNTGYMWVGKKPPSKKDPQRHMMDAHVHFIYWAVKTNRIKLEDLL